MTTHNFGWWDWALNVYFSCYVIASIMFQFFKGMASNSLNSHSNTLTFRSQQHDSVCVIEMIWAIHKIWVWFVIFSSPFQFSAYSLAFLIRNCCMRVCCLLLFIRWIFICISLSFDLFHSWFFSLPLQPLFFGFLESRPMLRGSLRTKSKTNW